jgi:hypothetical protein
LSLDLHAQVVLDELVYLPLIGGEGNNVESILFISPVTDG